MDDEVAVVRDHVLEVFANVIGIPDIVVRHTQLHACLHELRTSTW
jgi:hypothetical protein